MNNNIAIGFDGYDVEVSFIIAEADNVTSYGAVVATHTQCIVTKNGLVIGFGTAIKHEADKPNALYGCQMAMEKALANTDLTKWERGEFWTLFKSDDYSDRFDPELCPTKYYTTKVEFTPDDFSNVKKFLMDSIRKSIYTMPSDICHKGLQLGNDAPMLNDKGTPLTDGDEITTVGQLRYLMSELDDCDRIALECIDEEGDLDDHYPLSVETYDGVGLPNGTTGNEFRICQRLNPNVRNELINRVMSLKYGNDDEKNWDSNLAHLKTLTNEELNILLK